VHMYVCVLIMNEASLISSVFNLYKYLFLYTYLWFTTFAKSVSPLFDLSH